MADKKATQQTDKAKSAKPLRRRKRWPLVIVGVGVALVLLGAVSFVGATMLEEHDSFCTSCHTMPETTYYNRSQDILKQTGATVPDLATVHYVHAQQSASTMECISCHRGDSSLSQRAQTLALGARDTLIFFSGKADPAIEKTQLTQPALLNAACISCHTKTMLTIKGTMSHFHNWLPQTAALVASGQQLMTPTPGGGGFGGERRFGRLRTVNDPTITCTSCHLGHKTVNSDPRLNFVDPTYAQAACDSCHKTAGERPQKIDRLLRGGDD